MPLLLFSHAGALRGAGRRMLYSLKIAVGSGSYQPALPSQPRHCVRRRVSVRGRMLLQVVPGAAAAQAPSRLKHCCVHLRDWLFNCEAMLGRRAFAYSVRASRPPLKDHVLREVHLR